MQTPACEALHTGKPIRVLKGRWLCAQKNRRADAHRTNNFIYYRRLSLSWKEKCAIDGGGRWIFMFFVHTFSCVLRLLHKSAAYAYLDFVRILYARVCSQKYSHHSEGALHGIFRYACMCRNFFLFLCSYLKLILFTFSLLCLAANKKMAEFNIEPWKLKCLFLAKVIFYYLSLSQLLEKVCFRYYKMWVFIQIRTLKSPLYMCV